MFSYFCWNVPHWKKFQLYRVFHIFEIFVEEEHPIILPLGLETYFDWSFNMMSSFSSSKTFSWSNHCLSTGSSDSHVFPSFSKTYLEYVPSLWLGILSRPAIASNGKLSRKECMVWCKNCNFHFLLRPVRS